MSDDPFAEPSPAEPSPMERTVIRPRPSGVIGGSYGGGRSDDRPWSAGAREVRPVPKTGSSPLVAAASPLLAAAVRITSDRGQAPDVDSLRVAMVAAMRRFETEALATGMDTRSLRAARYALCATIDDLVLSTPWGSASSWAQQSMTSIFHNEVTGGERFFDILDQMQQDLGHHAPVVELMYLCVSLGFIGRYRVMPRGTAAVSELRDGVYRTIRQRRGDFERELSPQWRGIAAGARRLSQRVPLWVPALSAVAVAAAMFVGFTFLLASISDVAFAELFSLPPRGEVTVPRAVAPGPVAPVVASRAASPVVPSGTFAKLRQFLAPEIKAGLVQVLQDAQTVTVRLTNRNMFGSGEATLATSYAPLLARIGDALNEETGNVMVYGFTDDQPIRTARFPSNFELSQTRADAVGALLRARLKDPGRLRAQGKGQADPIAANTTADGRQQNRRIEIVLVRASDAM
jgi:type VI secretion system protein ImpK